MITTMISQLEGVKLLTYEEADAYLKSQGL
jgi:hypothetical protein